MQEFYKRIILARKINIPIHFCSIETTVNKQRIEYFDVLKGIAIFLVVMGHVITYGVCQIDKSVVFRLIGSVHMPLFFFISGYFTVKSREGQFALPSLRKRFMQLMLPMLVVTALWIVYYPHSGLHKHLTCTFAGLYTNLHKNGYWFLWVLFAIISLYGISAKVSNMLRHYGTVWKYAPFALTLILLGIGDALLPKPINDTLSLMFVFKYSFVFMFGGIARALGERFTGFAQSDAGYTASMVVTALLLIFVMYPEWLPFKRTALMLNSAQVVLHCSLATFAVGLCKSVMERHQDGSRGVRLWSLLGRRSLQIYLFHYFFLFPLGWIRPAMLSMGLDLVPVALTAALCAAVITACCLAVDAVMRRSRLLSLLCGEQN